MSSPSPSTPAAAPPPKYLRPGRASVVLMSLLAIIGIVLVLRAWQLGPFAGTRVQTDDAYVRGQVTVLAPQVAGHVEAVLVTDFDHVRKGQPLLHIDDRSYREKLAQAEAALAEARAALANSAQVQAQGRAQIAAARADLGAGQAEQQRASAELARYEQLAAQRLVSASDRDKLRSAARTAGAGVDQARARIRIAEEDLNATQVARQGLEAKVASAEAAVQLARLDLEHTVVRAPRDGQLSEVSVHPGQYVSAGSQLLFLVPDQLWVVANVKEVHAGRVALGQPVELQVDAFPGQPLHGHVQEIAPATGSEFALLKADNASGNFTKVVQRLPVKIALDPGQPLAARLRPGMSVVAKIETAPPAGGVAAR